MADDLERGANDANGGEYSRRGQSSGPRNIADLFWRMGYNINSDADLSKLAEEFRWLRVERARTERDAEEIEADRRWLRDEREKAEKRSATGLSMFIAFGAAVAGGIITWVLSRIKGP